MRSEDLSRRDIKPGLIIYPQPDTFFKDTEYYKFIPIPTPQFPYVCLHVNDEESEWARIIRKDAPNNIRVDRKGVLNPSEGFLWGESFVSYDERFKIPVSNVMAACQNSRVPRPAFSPPVTKKIRESFGYEPKTEGTPLAMATISAQLISKSEPLMKKTAQKNKSKTWNASKEAYKKMVELHTKNKMGSKEIAHLLDVPILVVKQKLKRDKVYNENLDLFKYSPAILQSDIDPPSLTIEEQAAKLKADLAALQERIDMKQKAQSELDGIVEKYKKEGFHITYEIKG